MSLSGPALEVGASNATGDLNAGAEAQTVVVPEVGALPKADLLPIYYGAPAANVIEISFRQCPVNRSRALRFPEHRRYRRSADHRGPRSAGKRGVTLPEAVAYGRVHIRHATRITNADIDRLHSGM